mmetsp:Transcript_48403/g.128178  ORF Transcript_48403/g.128178 Transcript_48403/m.128178 type:complete len:428 (-) Transcript_48403:279-1562(-)
MWSSVRLLPAGCRPLTVGAFERGTRKVSGYVRKFDVVPRATCMRPLPALTGSIHRSVRSFATLEVKTPEFGAESITEGSLMEWNKKVGDYVEAGELLVSIETDKVTVDVLATKAGTLKEISAEADQSVEVGQVLAVIELGGSPPAKSTVSDTPGQPIKAASAPAVPAASSIPAASAQPTATQASSEPEAASSSQRSERRVKMTRMRRSIAKNLKVAQDTAAMLTTFQEVDMHELIALRKQYKDVFEQEHGVRLGFMSAFAKASAFALQQIPGVNAVIDDTDVVYRDYVDISIAVASPRGLVVPVLRNVESMTMDGVERAISDYARKAKTDTLKLEEMQGGTFTITNGGVFGSMMGTPIINGSQSAILGMHATKERPVVMKNGDIRPRPIMYLALTYDHRLVDGREAVTFLCTVRDLIEDPRRLLLQL